MLPHKLQSWQAALKTFFHSASPRANKSTSGTSHRRGQRDASVFSAVSLAAIDPAEACRLVNSAPAEMPPRLRLVLFTLLQRQKKLLVSSRHGALTFRSYAAAIRAADECPASVAASSSSSSSSSPQKQQHSPANSSISLGSLSALEWLPRSVWEPPREAKLVSGAKKLLQPEVVTFPSSSSSTESSSSSSTSENIVKFSAASWSALSLVAEVWALAISDRVLDNIVHGLLPKVRALVERESKISNSELKQQEEDDEELVEKQQKEEVDLESAFADLAPALAAAAHLYAALYNSRQHLLFSAQTVLEKECDPVVFDLLDVLSLTQFSGSFAGCALAYCELSTALSASLRVRGGCSPSAMVHLTKAVRILSAARHDKTKTAAAGAGGTAAVSASGSSSVLHLSNSPTALAAAPSQAGVLTLPVRAAAEWCCVSALSGAVKWELSLRVFSESVKNTTDGQAEWVCRRQKHFEERVALEMGELEEREAEAKKGGKDSFCSSGADVDDFHDNDDDGYDAQNSRKRGHEAAMLLRRRQQLERQLGHALRRDKEMARQVRQSVSREVVRSGSLIWKAVTKNSNYSAPPPGCFTEQVGKIVTENGGNLLGVTSAAAAAAAVAVGEAKTKLIVMDEVESWEREKSESERINATQQLRAATPTAGWTRRRGLSFNDDAAAADKGAGGAKEGTRPENSVLLRQTCIAIFHKSNLNRVLAPAMGPRPSSALLFLRYFLLETTSSSSSSSSSSNAAAGTRKSYNRTFHFPDGTGWCRAVDPASLFRRQQDQPLRGRYPLVLQVSLPAASATPMQLVTAALGCLPNFCVVTEEQWSRSSSNGGGSEEVHDVFVPDALTRLLADIRD